MATHNSKNIAQTEPVFSYGWLLLEFWRLLFGCFTSLVLNSNHLHGALDNVRHEEEVFRPLSGTLRKRSGAPSKMSVARRSKASDSTNTGISHFLDLGHATLRVVHLISAIAPSEVDLGHTSSRVVCMISASLYPVFLCPVLVFRPGLLAVLCHPNVRKMTLCSNIRS